MSEHFTVRGRLHSFGHAFRGLRVLLATQHNARIHLAATIVVIIAGLWLGISTVEWLALVIAISMVWIAEGLNTAIEFLGDAVTLEQHPLIKNAKDVAAAAVLIASVGAVAVALLILV